MLKTLTANRLGIIVYGKSRKSCVSHIFFVSLHRLFMGEGLQ